MVRTQGRMSVAYSRALLQVLSLCSLQVTTIMRCCQTLANLLPGSVTWAASHCSRL